MNNIFTEENASSQTTKSKRFWSYIKHQRSSNAGLAPLKKDGRLTSDPKEQVLNLQFQSVFGDGKRYTEEEFMQKTGMHDCDFPTMEDIEISERGVEPKPTQGLWSRWHTTTCAEGACKRDCTCTDCSF